MEQFPSSEILQLFTKFPQLMEPEGALPCSQQPTPCPYPEYGESSPRPLILGL